MSHRQMGFVRVREDADLSPFYKGKDGVVVLSHEDEHATVHHVTVQFDDGKKLYLRIDQVEEEV